ncbi:MAG TPA: DUF3011 domain-containing protein [Vicinamibacterales bacterium]|nr:DUF3011 domain-containing protein [Vicinamibacterales bacterium]
MVFVLAAVPGAAQGQSNEQAPTEVACTSTAGTRAECPANASAGAVLLKSTSPARCELGKTWGFDDTRIWVSDGCSATFAVAQAPPVPAPTPAPDPAPPQTGKTGFLSAPPPKQGAEQIETWGEFDPGKGFLVGRSDAGELEISAYGLIRYMNQMPAHATFLDHLGNERTVDGRNDLYPHRIMVFFKGWLGNEKLVYNIFFWTVNPTDQKNFFATVGYQFGKRFSLYAGLNGLPGTRSLQGSHPYWLGHDRVMADEFFRPYFSNGIWAQGQLTPGLWYNVMASNNLSALGIKATQLDRKWGWGGSAWWMPTTKEFGPRGGYGDWEYHDKLATRIGVSTTYSPEERYTDANTGGTGNTTVKLADSLNIFDTGALAPGVTVNYVDYRLLSIDAGLKYKGIFLQTELYFRELDLFRADGPLPLSDIHDKGFYVQGAFFPIKKKIEVYAATSQIYGDKSNGFSNASEYIAGGNWYPFDTRNHRLNLQYQKVNHSPVSSTFGYYVGGQTGHTFSTAFSVFF